MKFSKDGHELGMSKVGTVVLGKNAFGQTVEGLRKYFVDILAGRTNEADNAIDTIATVRGNCLERGVADIAIQELLRVAPKGVSVTLSRQRLRIEINTNACVRAWTSSLSSKVERLRC